jgi:hypothetical protein
MIAMGRATRGPKSAARAIIPAMTNAMIAAIRGNFLKGGIVNGLYASDQCDRDERWTLESGLEALDVRLAEFGFRE